MHNIFHTKRAETLVEVIIAVTILATVIGPASAIQVSALRTTSLSRSDLVATGIAEEGIEMVRNMRDTNLLRFSSKQECWNTRPDYPDTGTACEADSAKIGYNAATGSLASGAVFSYRLEFTLNPASGPRWNLAAPAMAASRLSQNLGAPEDAFFRMYLDESIPMYDHDSAATPTDFYREITIANADVLNSVPGIDTLGVSSRVRYRAGGGVRTVTRAAIIKRP